MHKTSAFAKWGDNKLTTAQAPALIKKSNETGTSITAILRTIRNKSIQAAEDR
jgi:hypothetical protein